MAALPLGELLEQVEAIHGPADVEQVERSRYRCFRLGPPVSTISTGPSRRMALVNAMGVTPRGGQG